ncbi:MAG: hypothetical protein JSS02_27960 [Planctomycetes bacterium]|nr:hypothetical protein [Planctomycetota bacterium]
MFLVRRIENGDRQAIELLWRSTERRLRKYFVQRFRGRPSLMDDEETLASDTFVVLYQQIASGAFRRVFTESHFWAIINTVANRRYIDKRRTANALKNGGKVQFEPADSLLACASRDLRIEIIGELDEEIAETIRASHDLLLGRIYELLKDHFTRSEIAEALHVSQDTIDRRLKWLAQALFARTGYHTASARKRIGSPADDCPGKRPLPRNS